jgi:hypothetical protein
MSWSIENPSRKRRLVKSRFRMLAFCIGCVASLILCFLVNATAAVPPAKTNLALNKPASASSIENDDEDAAKANDGDEGTFWCADDEPENGAEWWKVDLEKPANLTGCRVVFPYAGKRYLYKVEGSADEKAWIMLSDQTQTSPRTRARNLKFSNAKGIRYLKITITGFDEGVWASISEVQVYGNE